VKYHDKSIPDEDKNIIRAFLPLEQLDDKYNPYLSDPVKSSFNQEAFTENKAAFLKLWGRLFADYPKTYLAAFLYNTYGYAYPFFPSSTTTDIILDNDIHFNAIEGYSDDAYDEGFKQAIAEYRNLVTSIVPILQNIGIYFCVVLFGAYISIIRKRRELVGVFTLLSCVFLTTILGPVNGEFRYLYLFVIATPFVLGSAYSVYTPKRSAKKHD